jgi:hypothetical protein
MFFCRSWKRQLLRVAVGVVYCDKLSQFSEWEGLYEEKSEKEKGSRAALFEETIGC